MPDEPVQNTFTLGVRTTLDSARKACDELELHVQASQSGRDAWDDGTPFAPLELYPARTPYSVLRVAGGEPRRVMGPFGSLGEAERAARGYREENEHSRSVIERLFILDPHHGLHEYQPK